jgi:hypothetical protein
MRSVIGVPTGYRALVWLTTLGVLVFLAGWTVESAADSVKITVPATVGFAVTNVGASTTGNPSATTVSFSSLSVTGTHVLRISIKADSNFIPPSGAAIPASKVSWTTSAALNGTGNSGVLSTTTYNQVFLAGAGKKNGSVNVSWTLAAPGTPLRAGTHTVIVRWKLESF